MLWTWHPGSGDSRGHEHRSPCEVAEIWGRAFGLLPSVENWQVRVTIPDIWGRNTSNWVIQCHARNTVLGSCYYFIWDHAVIIYTHHDSFLWPWETSLVDGSVFPLEQTRAQNPSQQTILVPCYQFMGVDAQDEIFCSSWLSHNIHSIEASSLTMPLMNDSRLPTFASNFSL